jgi:hypothetical protein
MWKKGDFWFGGSGVRIVREFGLFGLIAKGSRFLLWLTNDHFPGVTPVANA